MDINFDLLLQYHCTTMRFDLSLLHNFPHLYYYRIVGNFVLWWYWRNSNLVIRILTAIGTCVLSSIGNLYQVCQIAKINSKFSHYTVHHAHKSCHTPTATSLKCHVFQPSPSKFHRMVIQCHTKCLITAGVNKGKRVSNISNVCYISWICFWQVTWLAALCTWLAQGIKYLKNCEE